MHTQGKRGLMSRTASINKDRSAFILDIACREAENVLLNQYLFLLECEAFES